MQKRIIKKAVIAAAGFGTRFLPQTKAMPKEMLPLVDTPIIQYIVEELVGSGVEDIVIVTGYHKRSIEDHFDHMSTDLRQNLKQGGKLELLEETKKISELANFAYVRQKGPYGNATPLMCAEHLLGDEPFYYAFADDFVKADPSRFKQLLEVHWEHGGTVLTCVRAQNEQDYKRYGFVAGEEVTPSLMQAKNIIEKPGSREKAGSDFATVSGYIIDPAIFPYLHEKKKHLKEGEEFIMQTAMQDMIEEGHKIFGCEVQNGTFYDAGNKLDYMKTIVDFALAREDIGEDFKNYLKAKLQ
ncbi:MAG: sugar phosphate nucleotidyltransferase [Candidatus Saccharibacteria bacterium]|nr:sugar phosphate nucleotidyltransferase [Candidatus Saccharibacteria bacterium]